MALANIPARRLIKIAKNSHRAIEDRADVAECLVNSHDQPKTDINDRKDQIYEYPHYLLTGWT